MARKRTKAQVDESEELLDRQSPKRIWHPLTLQRVPLGRFVEVVNQILQGKLAVFDSSLKGASGSREIDGSSKDDPKHDSSPGK